MSSYHLAILERCDNRECARPCAVVGHAHEAIVPERLAEELCDWPEGVPGPHFRLGLNTGLWSAKMGGDHDAGALAGQQTQRRQRSI